MNTKFDELTKSLAQSVTRRAALKKFGVGLAGMALACFGLTNKTRGATSQGYCQTHLVFSPAYGYAYAYTGACVDINACVAGASADCPLTGTAAVSGNERSACGLYYRANKKCSF